MTTRISGDMTGQLLGDRYELRTKLGEGGMGVVYRAQDTMLGREVAIKIFREGATETARTAFETQLLAGLNHPSLVTLFDAQIGSEEPRYLVMEYVGGPTLEGRLMRGPLSERTTARVARDLSEALHVVHEAGVVHRDVKPANVLLRAPSVPGEEFHAKLADFGIAHLVDTTRLTTPGTIIGSAAYLSPEQVAGADPRPASDIYSLGLVLLEALTGRRAFAQKEAREALVARLTQDPIIPSSVVGHEWGTLLIAMTARDPESRPTAIDVANSVPGLSSTVSMVPGRSAASATVGHSDAAVTDAGEQRGVRATERTAVLAADSETGVNPDPVVGETGETRPRADRRRWLIPSVLAAVLVAITVGAVAVWGGGEDPAPRPDLPALEEPLDRHLQQLLDAVSP